MPKKHNTRTSQKNLNMNDHIDIILLFPESISSESLIKEFILSKNDIRQSNFLSILLDNTSEDEEGTNKDNNLFIEDNKIKIKIPDNLYKGIRYIDLVYFIDLWKGKEIFNESCINNDKLHNFKSIKKLCDSLMLNEDLYFVKKLMTIIDS